MTEGKAWIPEGNMGVVPLTKFHRKVMKKALDGLILGMPPNGIYEPLSYSAHPENGVVVVRFSKDFLDNKVYFTEEDNDIYEMKAWMAGTTGRSRCRPGDAFDLKKGVIIATWKFLLKLVDISSSIRKALIKQRTRSLHNALALNAEVRTKMAAMLREKFGVENV